jgi:hypothetical protein
MSIFYMYDVVPYVHFFSYRVFVYNRLNFLICSVISSVKYLLNFVAKGVSLCNDPFLITVNNFINNLNTS